MTVVAWDGTTLAADKLGDSGGLTRTTTKIRRFDGGLFGSAGYASKAAEIFVWIAAGADPEKVPAFQLTDDYQVVLVVRNDGRVFQYANSAHPWEIEDPFHAIGSGRDFAMAAMHLGCNASDAVRVTCALSTECGVGIDSLELP